MPGAVYLLLNTWISYLLNCLNKQQTPNYADEQEKIYQPFEMYMTFEYYVKY